mmetsp:Transcript_31826/g.61289  ORF Transcript_31826/g.61289 Transcript_31826/m.61289 type:complete len:245 (-) Transcript_31826:368-1102(-)
MELGRRDGLSVHPGGGQLDLHGIRHKPLLKLKAPRQEAVQVARHAAVDAGVRASPGVDVAVELHLPRNVVLLGVERVPALEWLHAVGTSGWPLHGGECAGQRGNDGHASYNQRQLDEPLHSSQPRLGGHKGVGGGPLKMHYDPRPVPHHRLVRGPEAPQPSQTLTVPAALSEPPVRTPRRTRVLHSLLHQTGHFVLRIGSPALQGCSTCIEVLVRSVCVLDVTQETRSRGRLEGLVALAGAPQL